MTERSDDAAFRGLAELAADLRVLVGKLRRRLRDQVPPGDLTWPQMAVLGHLDREGPATLTALAQAEGVRTQSMGATVAGLLDAGLVAGSPDPADGRRTILSLTPACRAIVLEARAAREDWLHHALETRLTPDEQAELAHAMRLLARIVQP